MEEASHVFLLKNPVFRKLRGYSLGDENFYYFVKLKQK